MGAEYNTVFTFSLEKSFWLLIFFLLPLALLFLFCIFCFYGFSKKLVRRSNFFPLRLSVPREVVKNFYASSKNYTKIEFNAII